MEFNPLEILKETDGVLTGHFCLTSGLHSDTYFQCAKLYQYPEIVENKYQNAIQKLNKNGLLKLLQQIPTTLKPHLTYYSPLNLSFNSSKQQKPFWFINNSKLSIICSEILGYVKLAVPI